MSNDIFIHQVFCIYIKFPDIHVKTIFLSQCNYVRRPGRDMILYFLTRDFFFQLAISFSNSRLLFPRRDFFFFFNSRLFFFQRHWNLHKIRPSTNTESPPGRPDVLFFLPQLQNTLDCKTDTSREDIEIAKEMCCSTHSETRI